MMAPSTNAAAKPLFPALVSVGELLRLSPINSARAVAALAGGRPRRSPGWSRSDSAPRAQALSSPPLSALQARRWDSGLDFQGPRVSAEALALGTTLAFLSKRPLLGGVLAGLAVTARPELLALALAAALAGAASPRRRHDAVAGATAGLATVALVIGVLRPPLSGDTLALLPAAAGLGCLAALGLVLVERLSACPSPVSSSSWPRSSRSGLQPGARGHRSPPGTGRCSRLPPPVWPPQSAGLSPAPAHSESRFSH